jgi:hypothetical protein
MTGWSVTSTCSTYGAYDLPVKGSARHAVNGKYLYQHYATCNQGKLNTIEYYEVCLF